MSIHVVVCDDEPHVARMISCRLMRADFEVHSAHDCETAWDVIHRVRPQLLVTDLHDPAVELVCRLRATPGLAELPVIALTSTRENIAAMKGLQEQLGLYALLAKPFSPRCLVRLAAQATGSPSQLAAAV
jgi:two-component system alkaline phosphatase synthesis response regulator PhoP